MTKFIENKVDGSLFNVDNIINVRVNGSRYIVLTVSDGCFEVDEDFYNQCRNMHKNPLLTMEYKPYVNTGPR